MKSGLRVEYLRREVCGHIMNYKLMNWNSSRLLLLSRFDMLRENQRYHHQRLQSKLSDG